MSEKIIYTKFSNDRTKSFRILTQIIDDGSKRFIRKKATCEASINHIKKMIEHEKKLSVMFKNTKFSTNKIIAIGDDFVDFMYVEGIGYDKMLDEFLQKNNVEEFKNAVSEFFSELDKLATLEFHENEKKIELFGNNVIVDVDKAIPVGNIDLIFQNVIVTKDGKWIVIDYEWTFDFAIPIKYLKWRSLYNLSFFSHHFASLSKNEYFSCFSISEDDRKLFKSIEDNGFQKTVGSGSSLGKHLAYMRKSLINPYVIEQSDCIEVFYDTGNGFSEIEKDVFYQFPINIFPPNNLQAIRIDPSCKYCTVSDIEIIAAGKKNSIFFQCFSH